MQTWTVDEMLSHNPCNEYNRNRLIELWAGRERLSVLDIVALDIPAPDRVWACLTAGEHVPRAVERIVTRAVRNHALHCGIEDVERWAADWLSGADRSMASGAAASASAAAALALASARSAKASAALAASAKAAASAALAASAKAAASAVLAAGTAAEAVLALARSASGALAAEHELQLKDIVEAVAKVAGAE